MKTISILVLCLMSITIYAQSDEEIIKKLQNSYMQFLKEEGFAPVIDQDGDVKFKREGVMYYLRPTANSRYFLLSRWISNENKIQDLKIHRAMNASISQYKAVRIYGTSDYAGIWVEIGSYLGKEDDFKLIFYRVIEAVADASTFFLNKYEESQ